MTRTLARWATRARTILARRLYLDTHDYRRSVFIAGTGRSGTTWLGDIVNYANAYRVMFEPFHSTKVPLLRHFRYRQYLRPDCDDPRYVGPIMAILSGAVTHPWIDRFNGRLIATRRLIKDIRANHLLGWIKANAPEVPLVLLLRHPCAVACSKLAMGWHTHLDEFLAQPDLMGDYLEPFRDEITMAETPFEKHIFMWCIENYVPMKQLKEGEYHLAHYEMLCTQPEDEIGKVFRFLGIDYHSNVVSSAQTPSATCRRDSAVISRVSLTESWRRHLTPEQVRRSVDILRLFGLDTIYSDGPWPCR